MKFSCSNEHLRYKHLQHHACYLTALPIIGKKSIVLYKILYNIYSNKWTQSTKLGFKVWKGSWWEQNLHVTCRRFEEEWARLVPWRNKETVKSVRKTWKGKEKVLEERENGTWFGEFEGSSGFVEQQSGVFDIGTEQGATSVELVLRFLG